MQVGASAISPASELRPSRLIDLFVLAAALPVFIIAGLPLLGWGAAATGWIAQRAVMHYVTTHAAGRDRSTVFRLVATSMVARLWLITLPILVIGLLSDDETGLSAAILAAVLITIQFGIEAFTGAGRKPKGVA